MGASSGTGAPPPLDVGSEFRGWRLMRRLARGGNGEIFVAKHLLLDTLAAVKVIRPRGGAVDQHTRARFEAEIEVHFALRHPNVPELYDAAVLEDGTAVLVTELLDGFDLKTAIARARTFSPADALVVAAGVLRPLAAMHKRAFHRDVSPGNIFLCRYARRDAENRREKGRVRLLDFGLTKRLGKVGPTREGMRMGTVAYSSPEQLRGDELTPGADLYSVGAVLYELLSGRPLFVDDLDARPREEELIKMHLTVVPDIEGELRKHPPEVRAFVATLLAKDPKFRYPTAEAALWVAVHYGKQFADTLRLFRDDVEDLEEILARLARERGPSGGVSASAGTSGEHSPAGHARLEDTAVSAYTYADVQRALREQGIVIQSMPDIPPGGTSSATSVSAAGAEPTNGAPSLPSPSTEHQPQTTERVPITVPLPEAVVAAASPATIREPVRAAAPPPLDFTTERVSYARRDVPEWEKRIVECAHARIGGPRCFRSPALVMSGRTLPLAAGPTTIGSDPSMALRLPWQGVAPHHATIDVRLDGPMIISPSEAAPGAFLYVGRELVDAPTEITCGATIRVGSVQLEVVDLALRNAPPSEPSALATRPTLIVVDLATGDLQMPRSLVATLTLIGSSPACEAEIADAPDVGFGAWLRGDGLVEIVSLDTSKLPYGDAIVDARLVEGVATFPLANGRALVVARDTTGLGAAIAEAVKRGRVPPHWKR